VTAALRRRLCDGGCDVIKKTPFVVARYAVAAAGIIVIVVAAVVVVDDNVAVTFFPFSVSFQRSLLCMPTQGHDSRLESCIRH
jgi:hypothetical protein